MNGNVWSGDIVGNDIICIWTYNLDPVVGMLQVQVYEKNPKHQPVGALIASFTQMFLMRPTAQELDSILTRYIGMAVNLYILNN